MSKYKIVSEKSIEKTLDCYYKYILINKCKLSFYNNLHKVIKRLEKRKVKIKINRISVYRITKKCINQIIEKDPSIKDINEVIYLPGFKALLFHRLLNYLYQNKLYLTSKVLQEKVREKTLIDIHPGAKIKDIVIDHGCGVVIGETAEIDSGVIIYQNVTIGANNPLKDKNKRHPTIEKNCIIYANSIIIGNKKILKNSIIKAGEIIKINQNNYCNLDNTNV